MTYAIGGYQAPSQETKGLKAIKSDGKPFVNKDFVKNIAYLNNTTDYMASFMQTMQSGIDDANRNAFEQIEDFIADIIVLFAGLDPQNFDFGDLKYIIQGLGALLGFSPDTPFPLNLFDAAEHFLSTYLIPLPQFTDVIFDAITAWGESLGLSPAFIQSLHDLLDAFDGLTDGIASLTSELTALFDIFGITGFPEADFGPFGELWDSILAILQPILEAGGDVLTFVSDQLAPLIELIADIVNTLNPSSWISAGQIRSEGSEIAPVVANRTTQWAIGSNPATTWVFDAANSSAGTDGSFTTNGNGTAKRVLSAHSFDCAEQDVFNFAAQLKWAGVPSGSNGFGACVVWYLGGTEVLQQNLAVAPGHGASGGFTLRSGQVTTPATANNFKIGFYTDATVTSGTVNGDAISIKKLGTVDIGLINGLQQALEGLMPFDFFDDIVGIPGATPSDIINYFGNFLNMDSPIPAGNLFGFVNDWNIPFIPVSAIGDSNSELLVNGGFDTNVSVIGNPHWHWTGTDGDGTTPVGSVYVDADGSNKELLCDPAIKVSQGQTLHGVLSAYYSSVVGYLSNPGRIFIAQFNGANGETRVADLDLIVYGAAGPNLPWVTGVGVDYTVPAGVTYIRFGVGITSGATAGRFGFDSVSFKRTGVMPQNFVKDLPANLTDIFGKFTSIFDIFKGSSGGVLADITNRIQNLASGTGTFNAASLANIINIPQIPNTKVAGSFGFSDISTTFQNVADYIFSGFSRVDAQGATLNDVASIANATALTAQSAADISEQNSEILAIRTNKPLYRGIDPTIETTLDLQAVLAGAGGTMPFVGVTSASSAIGFIRCAETATKGSVLWIGNTTVNITGIFIALYKMSALGVMTKLHESVDQSANVSSGTAYNSYEIPEANRFDVVPGDIIGVEMRVTGTGTYHLCGLPGTWAPDYPGIRPKRIGAKRTGSPVPAAPSTIADAAVVYSSDTPFFGIGIDLVDIGGGEHAPTITQYTGAGGYTYNIPAWAKFIDVVTLSGGGGGQGGGTGFSNGQGGRALPTSPGAFSPPTAHWNTHTIDLTATPGTTITGSVGSGGNGGAGGIGAVPGIPGSDGGNSTAVFNGTTISTGAGTNTAGFGFAAVGFQYGEGPGNLTYLGNVFYGGPDKAFVASGNQPVGNSPGGGGPGGLGQFGFGNNAGNGGTGSVWIVARAS